MVIRSYTGESVASALKQVRKEMGGDAVVLKTRVVDGENSRKVYEVTACLDQPTVEQADKVLQASATTATVETPVEPTVNPRVDLSELLDDADADLGVTEDRLTALEEKLDLLLQANRLGRVGLKPEMDVLDRAVRSLQEADVPWPLITEFFDRIRGERSFEDVDSQTISQDLTTYIDEIIDGDIAFKPGDRVVVVGLAGSGKTSVIGRLAAQLVHTGSIPVKLISLDNFKVGAHDEIASYADLLGVDPATGDPADEAADADADKVLLIDTCALPTDSERLSELKETIRKIKPTHRLAVFSALTRSSDIRATAREITWLEPTNLVFTQIDLTKRLGGILAATKATDVKLAMITDSPSGADSYRAPDAKAIADTILGREEQSE
jgi:flagellar biosynthesis protein FlhF